jgi:hypothetical protein
MHVPEDLVAILVEGSGGDQSFASAPSCVLDLEKLGENVAPGTTFEQQAQWMISEMQADNAAARDLVARMKEERKENGAKRFSGSNKTLTEYFKTFCKVFGSQSMRTGTKYTLAPGISYSSACRK